MKQFKDAIQISGGERITSGIVGANSIRDLKVTSSVCDQEDISIGSACASALDIAIIARGGNLSIADGTKIYLQHEYADGKYYQDGVYFCSQPVQKTQNIYKVTAYDAVSRLDKDLTEWLAGLTSWPYTVTRFSQKVCEACGVTLLNDPPHNSGYLVQKFVAGRITGRQLMKWCAEVGGSFIRANWKGEIIFDWYKSYESEFAADGSHAYRSGSLNHADYSTQPIDAVRIQLTEDDVGVIFPPDGNPKNVYNVTANYLLTTDNPKALAPVAESLYNVLKGVTYTPCKLKVDSIYAINPSKLAAGSIVPITDQNGKKIQTYVMKTVRSGITMSLESTGNESRSSVPAINDVSLGVLNHKMFELRKSVAGFDARITDVSTSSKEAVKKVNELSATVDGYTGRISAVEQSSKQAIDKVNELSVTVGGFDSRISSAETTANGASKKVNELRATVDGFSGRIENAEKVANGASQKVTELSATVDGFETRVSSAETTANGAKEAASSAKQTADSVAVEVKGKVSADTGHWNTFGYEMTADRWEVRANNKLLLKLTQADGLELNGKITTESGSIGGWGIDGSSIFYEDTANDKSLVMSINGGLYGGTGDREWHIRQNGAALFRSAEVYGDIYANNGFFKGTVYANRISYGGDSGYVSGKCLSNNSVTTTETSTGINGSLNYANFSNDVFNNRATAPYGSFTNLAVSKIAFGPNSAVEAVPVKIKVQTDQGLKELSLISWFRS